MKDVVVIISAIKCHSILKHLDLSCNSLDDKVADDLASAIGSNIMLNHIFLSKICFSIKKMGILLGILNQLNCLRVVDFNSCQISDAHADLLEVIVAENCALKYLQFNKFVWQRKQLKSLKFSHSKITGLQQLSINYTNIDEDEVDMITVIIKNNKNIKHLSFTYSIISDNRKFEILKPYNQLTH